ncbi:MAG: agmatine deiminase family protein, partial [Anaerolineae bacterium]|nr:agmatine deiminase family protein [Anaerolineae bacterium]NIO00199.1 agmatine deiminase family protein [Anaerolineae bacterium]NIQ82973.1 agmatine deiminase family protein [Anaerolineae bacterium]
MASHQDYRMPAEWETHEGTWLQWPQEKLYRGYELKLEGMWLTMVDALHRHENVHIIVRDERQRDHVEHQLDYFEIGPANVDMYIIPTDDVWARDNGPIFVVNKDGDVAITNWEFNGWAGRFAYQLDNQVPAIIAEQLSLPVFDPPMVLEGGAVEVNGKGTFMATRTSIIDPHRNPGKSQEEIEEILGDYLGVRHFI